MAASATDLIVPVGLLLWIFLTQFSVFFIFLWNGAKTGRISWSSIFGLICSVLSFAIGITPQPIFWVFDNQTTIFTTSYMIPQAQAVDEYLGLLVFQSFLVIVAVVKLMLDTDLLGGGDD